MIINTKPFFQLLCVHHRLPPAARLNDLLNRLTLIRDGRIRSDGLTQRCLDRFIQRRVAT